MWARWVRLNAVFQLIAASVVCWLEAPALLALAGAVSFSILVGGSSRAWAEAGGFGVANAITSVRLLLVLALCAGGTLLSGWVLASLALAIISLDGVDGWVARRFKTQSEFGGRYDYSVDAFFTLALSVVLLTRGTLGAWVLVAGVWHYVFVLLPLLIAPRRAEVERSRWGPVVFIVLVSSLTAAFVLPAAWANACAAVGVTAVSASFGQSLWQIYRPERAVVG